jgi:prepilin-type N-terminal cleavage/methylation domain-containing protein
MRKSHPTKTHQLLYHRRRGVTLTEVLMSLMIMGIGVVSLATLFPISTLRVLEATNLTNSTVARFNAEGIIDSFPQMIHNPDGISATRESGKNYIVDPLGWLELLDQGASADVTTAMTVEPPLPFDVRRYEYNRPTAGAYRITRPPIAQQTRFLGDAANPQIYLSSPPTNPVFPKLFTSIDIARQVASLQDTTTDYGEGFPTAYVPLAPSVTNLITGVELSIDEVDLGVFATGATAYQDPKGYQAVIFDVTGRYSEIRPIDSVSGQTINWLSPLPSRYSPIVGLVRIERVEPFYSWMLTVRKRASGPANVDVVVFSKRDFNELSEQLYVGDLRRFTLGNDGVPGTVGVDLNNDGNDNELAELGYPGSDDQQNNRVTVDWDPALYPKQPDKPSLRRGGFIFDAANALWYRVLSVEEAPTTTSAVLALEKAISRDNTEDLIYLPAPNTLDAGEDKNANSELDRGGIIIPKGVIAVFPLETKLLQ